jgi:hypothetical protein
MIIVRLSGGLGNQMFQYAAARRLAQRHGVPLHMDTGPLDRPQEGDTCRAFELDCFSLSAGHASAAERELCARFRLRQGNLLHRLLGNRLCLATGQRIRYVRERGFAFEPRVLSLPDNVCMDGFWQSERYFADVAALIREEYSFRGGASGENDRLAMEMGSGETVFLHIRRGDYLSNPAAAAYYAPCDLDYYIRALELMGERIGPFRLFVFSDDPTWAEANLKEHAMVTVVGHNSPDQGTEDLRLMTLCRHAIIANSSFGWWGAWLIGNRDKVVIAPQSWFRDRSIDTRALIPDGWLRL